MLLVGAVVTSPFYIVIYFRKEKTQKFDEQEFGTASRPRNIVPYVFLVCLITLNILRFEDSGTGMSTGRMCRLYDLRAEPNYTTAPSESRELYILMYFCSLLSCDYPHASVHPKIYEVKPYEQVTYLQEFTVSQKTSWRLLGCFV